MEMTAMRENRDYQQLGPSEGDDDKEETPLDSGVMIHLVPESSGKSRWNHIEDLDSFFRRMYIYHQKHGFTCMMLEEFFELAQFIYVVTFSIFLIHCVNYSVLFKVHNDPEKTWITDAIYPPADWLASFGLVTWISILIASVFWLLRLIKVLYHFIQFSDIKSFFNIALKINDNDLDNLTWHEVQKKIIEVQKEQEMCIHKRELTELDIYNRILRFENYMVAMMNKSLLPVRLKFPFLGDMVFLTRGLKYNLELLLFWGPWSPFENSWHLREDYKKLNKRQELARMLSKHILWVSIANLILCPFIFLWQILYFLYNYGELLKREPGALGIHMWSLYGRLYLRHFNELDHELNARLNRAYRSASKYMSMFTSPIVTVFAKNIAFISGSMCFVFVILTFYDEDFLQVACVLMIMTATGSIAAICRSLIPDENLVWCPESLLTAVLAHTHYRPDSWRNQAHTQSTRAQVAQLFQYRAVYLVEELLSPLLTPYILYFHLRYRALDIVDFYRNFTIEVTGVGDVCSFAQMDIRKHGHPMWQTIGQVPNIKEQDVVAGFENIDSIEEEKELPPLLSNQYTQAEDGKTELSLIHFTLTNPEWKPPSHAENFVNALRERAKREALNVEYGDINPLYASLNSLSSLRPEYNNIVANVFQSSIINQSIPNISHYNQQGVRVPLNADTSRQDSPLHSSNINARRGDVMSKTIRRANRIEGSPHVSERSLLYSLHRSVGPLNHSQITSGFGPGQQYNTETTVPLELTAMDMSLSTLYLHELHHRQIRRRGYQEMATRSTWQRSSARELATLPELGQERTPLLLHQQSSVRKTNS